MFRNSASPLHAPYRKVNLAASEESIKMQADLYAQQGISMKEKTLMSAEQWSEKLEECDYVFVMITDQMFEQDYAEVFADVNTIDNGTFYKVVRNQGKVSLNYIGQVPVIGYY